MKDMSKRDFVLCCVEPTLNEELTWEEKTEAVYVALGAYKLYNVLQQNPVETEADELLAKLKGVTHAALDILKTWSNKPFESWNIRDISSSKDERQNPHWNSPWRKNWDLIFYFTIYSSVSYSKAISIYFYLYFQFSILGKSPLLIILGIKRYIICV